MRLGGGSLRWIGDLDSHPQRGGICGVAVDRYVGLTRREGGDTGAAEYTRREAHYGAWPADHISAGDARTSGPGVRASRVATAECMGRMGDSCAEDHGRGIAWPEGAWPDTVCAAPFARQVRSARRAMFFGGINETSGSLVAEVHRQSPVALFGGDGVGDRDFTRSSNLAPPRGHRSRCPRADGGSHCAGFRSTARRHHLRSMRLRISSWKPDYERTGDSSVSGAWRPRRSARIAGDAAKTMPQDCGTPATRPPEPSRALASRRLDTLEQLVADDDRAGDAGRSRRRIVRDAAVSARPARSTFSATATVKPATPIQRRVEACTGRNESWAAHPGRRGCQLDRTRTRRRARAGTAGGGSGVADAEGTYVPWYVLGRGVLTTRAEVVGERVQVAE